MADRFSWTILLVLCGGFSAWAQSNTPIISGGAAFLSTTEGGATSMQPVIAPVIAIPLGNRWLIESRDDLRGFVSPANGTSGPYQAQFFGTVEYLQVDYTAASQLTITAGRFLTPFGIFNERLSAVWINKFPQNAPLIAGIGTAGGYSDGFMARGALISRNNYQINYTAYFSTLSSVKKFESERSTGGRVGIFFPHTRLQVGTSFQRSLQDLRQNSVGLDFTWQPYRIPLQLLGEWAHAPGGQGYWLQTAYRLSRFRRADSLLGRLEPVFRMQQFHRSELIPGDSLPAVGTQRADFGVNYYLRHEVRLNTSYAREFSAQGDKNSWNFGITYRFLWPL
jgi:hypothetical protein